MRTRAYAMARSLTQSPTLGLTQRTVKELRRSVLQGCNSDFVLKINALEVHQMAVISPGKSVFQSQSVAGIQSLG